MNKQSTKSPEIAALLNFLLVGVGNIYNGEITKGIVLVVIALILTLVLFSAPILFIPYLIFWIWGIIDAYNEAKKFNKSIKESEQKEVTSQKFNEKCMKLYRLLENDMISENEFNAKINGLIYALSTQEMIEEREDFLYGIIKDLSGNKGKIEKN